MQQEQRQRLEHELTRRDVPSKLRRRILQFFSFSGACDSELFALLPSTLRKQLDLIENRFLFLKVLLRVSAATISSHRKQVCASKLLQLDNTARTLELSLCR